MNSVSHLTNEEEELAFVKAVRDLMRLKNVLSTHLEDKRNGIAFEYDKQADLYTCSQGRKLLYSRKKTENSDSKKYTDSRAAAAARLPAHGQKAVPVPSPGTVTRNG